MNAELVPARTEASSLHIDFIGMLFALAVARVAERSADLVSKTENPEQFVALLPSFAHLLLATLLIATSWVGWGVGTFSTSRIEKVFSREFLELLIDVWLVVCYFIVAQGVVIPNEKFDYVPTYAPEFWWLTIIFATYAMWDIVDKWDDPMRYRQRGWASVVCGVGFAATWFFTMTVLQPVPSSFWNVLLIDAQLILAIFLFRAMKHRNRSDLTGRDWTIIGLLITGIIALGGLLAWQPEFLQIAPTYRAGVAAS